MLETAGWVVQDKDKIDWSNHKGIAIREYSTDTGPADYVLFINIDAAKFPIGIIEAKPEEAEPKEPEPELVIEAEELYEESESEEED